eukprot:Sspe_Gene.93943::Locus_66433_Transcript_1_1_Confidence_1.000_Length_1303::g.93943::m.93943
MPCNPNPISPEDDDSARPALVARRKLIAFYAWKYPHHLHTLKELPKGQEVSFLRDLEVRYEWDWSIQASEDILDDPDLSAIQTEGIKAPGPLVADDVSSETEESVDGPSPSPTVLSHAIQEVLSVSDEVTSSRPAKESVQGDGLPGDAQGESNLPTAPATGRTGDNATPLASAVISGTPLALLQAESDCETESQKADDAQDSIGHLLQTYFSTSRRYENTDFDRDDEFLGSRRDRRSPVAGEAHGKYTLFWQRWRGAKDASFSLSRSGPSSVSQLDQTKTPSPNGAGGTLNRTLTEAAVQTSPKRSLDGSCSSVADADEYYEDRVVMHPTFFKSTGNEVTPEGTPVHIYLPVSPRDVSPPKSPDGSQSSAGRSEHTLLRSPPGTAISWDCTPIRPSAPASKRE